MQILHHCHVILFDAPKQDSRTKATDVDILLSNNKKKKLRAIIVVKQLQFDITGLGIL